ncbi:MAG: AAC(3) family N-acetyltransferase [Anaerolineae bacterium]|nr:AAC(3) family N-acetyltransferase [Anaerolineae bacterium]
MTTSPPTRYSTTTASPTVVAQIAEDLLRTGVREGGVLLVHSSLSAMGHVPGGPETVIEGLLRALGPEGTLVMPGLSYEHVTRKQPYFDIRRTPSNVGVIPESFRQRAGTRRSMHPTHSVCAVGKRAAELLNGHAQDSTPCGPNSPFHRLPTVGGQILMLGCGLRPSTSMHAIEELAQPPYLFGDPFTYTLTDTEGRSIQKTYTVHNFDVWVQRYDRIGLVLDTPAIRQGQVLQAEVHLLEARSLWNAVLKALERDPLFFVDRETHP